MKKLYLALVIALLLVFGTAQISVGQIEIIDAFPNLEFPAFDSPLDFQHAGDGTDTVYVVERPGGIKKLENRSTVTSSSVIDFLDIRDRVNTSHEGGLLGLAFHPDFSQNGYFYVYYTITGTDGNELKSIISRFTVDKTVTPWVADLSSELTVLEIDQPKDNHNGGQIRFGPDGYFYIALGDGGSDSDENGQDRTTLLGSILRIDVDSPENGNNYGIPEDNPFVGNTNGWREEIFAYGLRNPWRFSFDSQTGDLWAADVGEGDYEEIDIIESGKNYGWNIMEGSDCYNPSSGCDKTGLELPVFEYDHGSGISVTGGFVYRGTQIPSLQGRYVYGDYAFGTIWSFAWDGTTASDNSAFRSSVSGLASFGEDRHGELYICSLSDKTIYKIVPDQVSQFDVPGTDGQDGWRFFGTSRTDETYAELLSSVWTQGATGASITSGTPNVWTYSQSLQDYEAVTDLTQTIPTGQGFIAYLYEDDDPNTAGVQGGWPKTISSSGTFATGDVIFSSVSYADGDDSSLNGLNLVANPYAKAINWDASGWTKTNINDAIWIWDPNANSGNGAWKKWVDGVGDPIYIIAPYQAFFVQANDQDPVLSATEDVQESWGTFLKSNEEPVPSLSFNLQTEGFEDKAYFAFREDAGIDKDKSDAMKLASLSAEHMQFYSLTPGDVSLAINSLPAHIEQKLEIPLVLETTQAGDFELSWEKNQLPAEWSITLTDSRTGKSINLDQQSTYKFDVTGTEAKQKQKAAPELALAAGMRMLKSDSAPRFKLTIDPNRDQTETPAEIPSNIVLDQNYPNPFNPTTVIRFGMPKAAHATLKIYNILGQEIRTLVNRQMEAGFHEVNFNAAGLSSGTYIYQITANGFTQSKKMLIMK